MNLKNIINKVNESNSKVSETIISSDDNLINFLTLADFISGVLHTDDVDFSMENNNCSELVLNFNSVKDMNKMMKYNSSNHVMFDDHEVEVSCQHIDKKVIKMSVRR